MVLARRGTTTCEGLQLSRSRGDCYRVCACALLLCVSAYLIDRGSLRIAPQVHHAFFSLSAAELSTEFPGAEFMLTDTSSCEQAVGAWNTPCCALRRASTDTRFRKPQPGMALQYFAVATCVHALLNKHPRLDVVLRTRPDVVYLDVPRLVHSVRAAALDGTAVMGRKSDLRAATPSDMFIAVAATVARAFFDSYSEPMQRACAHGDPNLGWNPDAEKLWFQEYGYFGRASNVTTPQRTRWSQQLLPVSKVRPSGSVAAPDGQVLCLHLKTSWWRTCCERLGGRVRNGTAPLQQPGSVAVCDGWEPPRGGGRSP
jgi:hypothetical protein